MKVVLLAGGLGSRLSEETQLKPKPMVEVGGQPILWHIMMIYWSHGFRDFIICLGYRGYVIKEYFANYVLHRSDVTIDLEARAVEYVDRQQLPPWRITLIDTGSETQTGGRLKRIAHLLPDDEPFCMTYGDGVSNVDLRALVRFHESHGLDATLTAVLPPGRFGATVLDGHRVARFAEKPAGDSGYINGGFFVLHKRTLDRIDGDETVWEQAPLDGLARDGQLAAFVHTGFWQPKIMDMQPALGLAQLESLDKFVEARCRNWQYLRAGLDDLQHIFLLHIFLLPRATAESDPSWFAFCLTLHPNLPFERNELLIYLNNERKMGRGCSSAATLFVSRI